LQGPIFLGSRPRVRVLLNCNWENSNY